MLLNIKRLLHFLFHVFYLLPQISIILPQSLFPFLSGMCCLLLHSVIHHGTKQRSEQYIHIFWPHGPLTSSHCYVSSHLFTSSKEISSRLFNPADKLDGIIFLWTIFSICNNSGSIDFRLPLEVRGYYHEYWELGCTTVVIICVYC